jgi:integrase
MRLPKNVRRHSSGRFRAVVSIAGKRHVGPLRVTPVEAEHDVLLLREDLDGVDGLTTLRKGERLLIADLEARGSSPHTADYYRAHLRVLTTHGWGLDVAVKTITVAEVERYARKRKAAGIADSTIWGKELQALDRICRLLIQRGELATSPVRQARRPKIRTTRFGVLSAQQVADAVARIRATGKRSSGRTAAVVSVLFLTGMRRAELSRLRVADVDEPNRRVFIRGKTGDRYVPLSDEALAAILVLTAGKADDRPVVGEIRTIERIVAQAQTDSQQPLLTPHVLRHSHATAAARAGVPAFTLAAILGHSDTRQTARYYHLGGAEARAAVDAVSLRHLRVSEDPHENGEPSAPAES